MAAKGVSAARFVFALAIGFAFSEARAQTAPGAFLAPTSEPVRKFAGAWDLSADNGRKCRAQLNARETRDGAMVFGAPPTCRMAISALGMIVAWRLGADGRIHLFRQDGGALVFARGGDGAFVTESEIGLKLTPVNPIYAEQDRQVAIAAAARQLLEGDAADPKRAAFVGVYAIARAPGDADCLLHLKNLPGPRVRGIGDLSLAALDESCGDAGLKTFDPAGWRIEEGRLFLMARKGQAIGFSRDRAGHWFRDPPAGRPLYLRKQ